MAWTFSSRRFSRTQMLLFLCVFLLSGEMRSCLAGPFGFSIHHRFSDSIKGLFDSEGLPEKHSPGYYATMVHRDQLVRGRRLATTNGDTPLTFSYGNETYLLNSLGFLFYANVSVGTPSLSFLVALDTGSDLFWLPCNDCTGCFTHLNSSSGETFRLNKYSPNDSTTSSPVPCSSPLCQLGSRCSSPRNVCPYQILYLSANTSSTGYLVEDVLHMATNDAAFKPVNAKVTFGCGVAQTGVFADGAAPNGLLGLGLEKVAVPSLLASQGLTSDSFSMCFGPDGIGRIEFGDTGTPGQRETPINPMLINPSYNVTFTEVSVGGKANNVAFAAIFDSGTSFTYLTDPVYTLIAEQMDAGMDLKRITLADFPFEYCYELPASTKTLATPELNFTMKGGDTFAALDAFVAFRLQNSDSLAVCLGIIKSTEDIDLIGQNFMTGYRVVFNREKMVLGWTEADCYDNGAGAPPDDSPPSDSPPTNDSPPTDDSPPSKDSPPTDDSPPSNDTPPTVDSPPSDNSPPSGNSPPSPPSGGNSTQRGPGVGGGSGDASRVNPLASAAFVAILAILAVV